MKMMTDFKKLSAHSWNEFGKRLLAEKGSEKQGDFLRACRAGKIEFLELIDNLFKDIHISTDNVIGEQEIEYTQKFSEQEFISPPSDVQEKTWDKFQDIPDEYTASCEFWGHIIITMIENESIQPVFLAGESNGETKKGAYKIDDAINPGDKKKTDTCARRILRSMCNPAPRGRRVVFDDFYLGKSYWRWRWAKNMSEIQGLEFQKNLEILDESYYAKIANKMHTGKSYISAKNTFGGLLLYLQNANKKKSVTGDKVEAIIDRLTYLSAWKAIEVQDAHDNAKEIQEIASHLQEKS